MTQKLELAMNPTSLNILDVLANASGRTLEEVTIDLIQETTTAKEEETSLIISERLNSLFNQTKKRYLISINNDAFERAIAKCRDRHVPDYTLLQAIHDNTGASLRWLCGGESNMYDIIVINCTTAREMYNIVIDASVSMVYFFTLGEFTKPFTYRQIIIATCGENDKFNLFKFDLMPDPVNSDPDVNIRKMAVLINFCLAIGGRVTAEGKPLDAEYFNALIGQSSYPGRNGGFGYSTWPQDIWDFDCLKEGRDGLRDTAIDVSNFIITLRNKGDAGLYDDREWARKIREMPPKRVWHSTKHLEES